MFNQRKFSLVKASDQRRVFVALIFLTIAMFSAVVHAATRAVEELEFERIMVWGSAEVEVSQGDKPHLRVRGSDSDLDQTPFYLADGVLHLGRTQAGSGVGGLKFIVTTGPLKTIALKGSGEVYVRPLEAERLEIAVEGSGDIKMFEVVGEKLKLSLSGSGSIKLAKAMVKTIDIASSGSGDIELGEIEGEELNFSLNGSGDAIVTGPGAVSFIDASLVGSGDLDTEQVRAQEIRVNIMGSGDARVWVETELDVSILGSGDVDYRGDPSVRTSVLGSGDVKRQD